MTTHPPLTPARAELLELLATCRPDWPRQAIERALWDAIHAGATFEQLLRAATRVALAPRLWPEAIGRQIAGEQTTGPTEPGDYTSGLAAARAALHHATPPDPR